MVNEPEGTDLKSVPGVPRQAAMVKGTDLKHAPACCRRGSVPGVPACCRRGTPYKVSLRDVFSLDSRLRGNDEGLRGMTKGLFPGHPYNFGGCPGNTRSGFLVAAFLPMRQPG